MRVDIYTSVRNGGKHLVVPAGTVVQGMILSPEEGKDLEEVRPTLRNKEIDPTAEYIGVSGSVLARQLASGSYAVVQTDVAVKGPRS